MEALGPTQITPRFKEINKSENGKKVSRSNKKSEDRGLYEVRASGRNKKLIKDGKQMKPLSISIINEEVIDATNEEITQEEVSKTVSQVVPAVGQRVARMSEETKTSIGG